MKVAKRFGKHAEPGALRLSLCDTNPEVVDAWIDHLRDLDGVEILQGSLLDVDCDALVSPANSFGDMSGGLDKQIDDFYRGTAQPAVIAAIRDEYLGELPVGAALVVEIEGRRPAYVVIAPTMRVPGPVGHTLHAYLAMRAALVAVLRHNQRSQQPIRTLAVPGLCTDVGGMHPGLAGRQMRAACDNVLAGGWKEVCHPAMAPFALGAAGGRRWSWTDREGSRSPDSR